jgi:hypothetical protein
LRSSGSFPFDKLRVRMTAETENSRNKTVETENGRNKSDSSEIE